MSRVYEIDGDEERYLQINLDELVPGMPVPFEIFAQDDNIIKSLLDKGSTYNLFAKKMIEKQLLNKFYVRQGNALTFDEYMHNAAKLKKMLLDPNFFESRYKEFRTKWFIVDKNVLNSGIPFSLRLGGIRFPVFGEIPFTIDSEATYRHLLDLDSDIVIRKQDIDTYYAYLDAVLDAEWIDDPVMKVRLRREKLKIWGYKLFEEARSNRISPDTLLGLYKHISINMALIINDLSLSGKILFFDVSDIFLYIHSTNVCLLSMMTGHLMGLEEAALLKLGIAAMLHDIGRVEIDDDLSEASSSDMDRDIYKSHVLKGKELLGPRQDVPNSAKTVALTHHEMADGSGYVYGLTGDKIHLFSKIVSVANTFETLRVTGFKHTFLKRGKALEFMLKQENRFDPVVLKTFVNFMVGVKL